MSLVPSRSEVIRSEAGARAGNRAAIEQLIGKSAADAFFAAEVATFPGRLGITHRDVPEMIARDYADVGLTQHHLISYWTRTFPNHFEPVPIAGAERFSVQIAFGRVINALRPRALKAFEEFFSAAHATSIRVMTSRAWPTMRTAPRWRSTDRSAVCLYRAEIVPGIVARRASAGSGRATGIPRRPSVALSML